MDQFCWFWTCTAKLYLNNEGACHPFIKASLLGIEGSYFESYLGSTTIYNPQRGHGVGGLKFFYLP